MERVSPTKVWWERLLSWVRFLIFISFILQTSGVRNATKSEKILYGIHAHPRPGPAHRAAADASRGAVLPTVCDVAPWHRRNPVQLSGNFSFHSHWGTWSNRRVLAAKSRSTWISSDAWSWPWSGQNIFLMHPWNYVFKCFSVEFEISFFGFNEPRLGHTVLCAV